MRRSTFVCALSVVVLGCPILAQQGQRTATDDEPGVRFAAVDVYIDAGDSPLAAYQFELAAEVGDIAIVGVEGGQHEAFAGPPYYDAAALNSGRIIIAAFDTGQDLPTGITRVARIHVRITGNTEPMYVVQMDVAADADGAEIEATATTSIPGEDE